MPSAPTPQPGSRAPRIRRWAFLAFTLALLAATLWPNLKVPVVVPRTDLWVHAGSFGTWTLLLAFSGLVGAWPRDWTIARCGVIGLAFSGANELAQGIPAVHRVVDVSDFLANALGVALAVGALIVLARVFPPSGRRDDRGFSDARP
ncbi:MAG: hypothetical protein JNJ48_03330 [Phycisphaerae bacterium]|nr:hypothetical protein [Phycisphaerae bacterium]